MLFKHLLFITIFLIAGAAVASEGRLASITKEPPSYGLGKHAHKAPPRVKSLQKIFLDSPLEKYVNISSAFGYRRHPVSSKWAGHQGIDYPAPKGTPIHATASGIISFIGRQNGYGNVIFIEHNSTYSTVYAHQSRFKKGLKKGMKVEKGQIIGYVGSTGTSSGFHLHYELRANNQPLDPIQEKQRLASYIQK